MLSFWVFNDSVIGSSLINEIPDTSNHMSYASKSLRSPEPTYNFEHQCVVLVDTDGHGNTFQYYYWNVPYPGAPAYGITGDYEIWTWNGLKWEKTSIGYFGNSKCLERACHEQNEEISLEIRFSNLLAPQLGYIQIFDHE